VLLVAKLPQAFELVNNAALMIKPAERYYDKVTEEAIPLKLKDWPPRTTFKETLPAHYTDYLRVCEACVRTKFFNLAYRRGLFLTVSPHQNLGVNLF
jgi:hypothetical protein